MDQHSFLFQSLIYLAAAVVMVPISKKMGLGSVLGYLLAGIVIGPNVMGFVGSEGQDIMHFAEFGVVMLLFIIGLELEPDLFWRLRKLILGLGGMQVVLTSAISSLVAHTFGLDWKPSLALGMIVSLSSTAIVLQTLSEKNLLKTNAGQKTFSVLLFQDIAVIPMLAFFPFLSESGASVNAHNSSLVNGLPGWAHALVVIGSVVGIILAGRFLIRPLFRIIAATRLREMFTATSLLIVVGIAVLMSQVGISPALGTFLAGVVLANSEYKHELESDVEPFKGLFLGLFFVAVGASIDFQLVMRHPDRILGLVVLLIFIKWIVLFVLGKTVRLGKSQNTLFSLALSQIGEFAFVLLSFSLSENIISKSVTDTMMAVVAISMSFTPLLMILNDKVLQPLIRMKSANIEREADHIDEQHSVIIAGFGSFGSTIGRFLRAHNIPTTLLDVDADRVENLRQLGFKVYFGDASRRDVLAAAGAERAKLIIIALEPAEKRLEMIETIKKYFPNLRMYVRAQNRFDAYNLMNAGMMNVYRETLDTALRLGVDVMKLLGYKEYTAAKAAKKFFMQDEANLKKLASIRDPDEYISAARYYIEELENILRTDLEQSIIRNQESEEDEAILTGVRNS